MPIVTIQTPQGGTVQIEAPEGATDAQILSFAKSQGLFDQQQSQTPRDVPTDENLAFNASQQQPPQDRGIGEQIIGAGEAALSLATGATGGAAGFLSAVPGAVVGELSGRLEQGEGLQEASQRAADFTFQPRSEAGQELVGDLSEALSVLPPVLGVTPLNTLKPLVTGRAVTDKLLRSSRAKRQLLADEIRKGNPNIELVTKALNETGDVITRPASKRAVKILGGDHVAEGTVAVIENMSPASKRVLNRQLDNISKGRREPLFGDANRPSNTLGESILDRAIAIDKVNTRAGKTIGNTAESLKDVNVNISQPKVDFVNSLNELGVTFTRGDDGWVTPDFSRSKFVGGSQKDMSVLINDLMNDNPGFQKAHRLKQTIRDNVNFDKGGTGQIKGASERLLKDLSRGIDEVLDSTSPKYKKANESFAKTIKLKNDFDKLMGKEIDLNDRAAASSILGNKAMRVDSNAPSGVVINKLFTDADSVLGDFKIKFKDDIPSLRHITNKLNDAFKIAPPNSLKGNIISGGLDVAEAATGNPLAAARLAAKAAKKDAPDFNKKMRAFKSLVNQNKD